MNEPASTLARSVRGRRGIAATFPRSGLFASLYSLLWGLRILNPQAIHVIGRALAIGDPHAAARTLTRKGAFASVRSWGIFWSVTHASMEMAAKGLGNTHEPELNGAYMALLKSSIAGFDPSNGRSGVACIIGDHATLGNEGRSGSDFGLILEVGRGIGRRWVVCLLQAKRATTRFVDCRRAAGNSTQLDRLVTSGIGSFLFYHGHGNPAGLGPTVADAHRVAAADPAHFDPVEQADDFAARLATAADLVTRVSPPFALPGFGAASSRSDAARLLFNPNLPDIEVNDVVVARMGDDWLSAETSARFEEEWAAIIDEHREAVNRIRGIDRFTTDEDQEPPIRRD